MRAILHTRSTIGQHLNVMLTPTSTKKDGYPHRTYEPTHSPPKKGLFDKNQKKHKMRIKTIKIVLRGETFWILSQTLSAPLPMFTRKKNRNQIDYLKTRNFGKEERRNLSLLAPPLSSTKSCSAFLFNQAIERVNSAIAAFRRTGLSPRSSFK